MGTYQTFAQWSFCQQSFCNASPKQTFSFVKMMVLCQFLQLVGNLFCQLLFVMYNYGSTQVRVKWNFFQNIVTISL